MQYLFLESEQIKCFPFISNPKKNVDGYTHEFNDYAEMFVPNLKVKENIFKINEYFEKKIGSSQMNGTDTKIWGILNPKVKSVIDKIDK